MWIRDRIDCVRDSLKAYIGNIASLEVLLTGIDQSSINQALAKEDVYKRQCPLLTAF